MSDWTPIDTTSRETIRASLPLEGQVVETMDSGGHVQPLVRSGNLFYFPDMSMYVYYMPKFWRVGT